MLTNTGHTVFKIQYHFVFVTKYRYQVLKGDIEAVAKAQFSGIGTNLIEQ